MVTPWGAVACIRVGFAIAVIVRLVTSRGAIYQRNTDEQPIRRIKNMDNDEKKRRCLAVEQRHTGEHTTPACRVYSRWVPDCADCSFSYLTRQGLGRN